MKLEVHPVSFSRMSIRPMPRLETRNLNKTLDTIQSCRVCNGSESGGQIIVKHYDGTYSEPQRCWYCKGSRLMSNRILEAGEPIKNVN